MREIIGRSPGERAERAVQIHRDNEEVSIWLHPPGSSKDSGWQAIVNLTDLRNALSAEGIFE